jgi:hypothetical protein
VLICVYIWFWLSTVAAATEKRLGFNLGRGLVNSYTTHTYESLVIGVVIGNVDDWPVMGRESFELWGFKVFAVLWLLRIGVHGLTIALQEDKDWRPLLAEVEHAWYQERVVEEDYEVTVEDTQHFASVFCKWGVNVGAQRRAQSLA